MASRGRVLRDLGWCLLTVAEVLAVVALAWSWVWTIWMAETGRY